MWFASGSEDNWNQAAMIYMDGDNSVKVTGITADKVALKFGDDGSTQFDALNASGAFLDASTEEIFTDKNKGVIVSL